MEILKKKGLRRCGYCKKIKELNAYNFISDKVKPSGLAYTCRLCNGKKQREWRKTNIEGYTRAKVAWMKRDRFVRDSVFVHYGDRCMCCGEDERGFLSIDHINNNGAEHRKITGSGSRAYRWILRNNYPADLQILCYNCNLAKAHNKEKICPHKVSLYVV